MGQGNAIAHLMPPPFYAYRYVVAKARAPESSIQEQINKIRDEGGPTPLQRYKVEVMPGRYAEIITMVPWIDVVAPYGKVIIQPASGTAGVTMASNCMLQGVEVNQTNQGDNATAVVIAAGNENVIVEDVWVTGGGAGDTGISDASTGTPNVNIRRCRIDSAATGYQKTGTGATNWFYDNRVTATTIDVDVDAGTLTLVECELMGTATNVDVGITGVLLTTTVNSWGNTLGGTGWVIADDDESAHAAVYSHDDRYTAVSHAGAGFMVDYESPQSYNVFNGMHIADALTDITDAVDLKRYVILVHPGEYDEAITMKHHIDLVGESNQSCVISQTGATVITAANNSRIKSVRVEMTSGAGHMGIICGDGIAGIVEDVIVRVTSPASGYNYAIYTTDTGGVVVYGSNFYASGAQTFAGTFAGTGTHKIYDSIFESVDTFDIWVSINGVVDSYNNKLLGNGWQIDDYANVDVRSYGDDYPAVTFVGTTNGAFADLSGCRLYTCASTVLIGEWVYASADDTVAEADADALATMPCIGVVVYKPDGAAGLTCYVKNYGYYYDVAQNVAHGDAFVNGEEYWVSATPGEITTTMHPVWPQRVGVALSTQRFKILIGDNLGLVHCNEYLCAHGEVAVGQWVYIAGTNNYVAETDAAAAATMGGIGVCVAILDDTGDPDIILIKLRGKYSMTHTDGWVVSDDIYIADDSVAGYNPGDITRDAPVGGIVQKVAEVKSYSDTTLIYEIAD